MCWMVRCGPGIWQAEWHGQCMCMASCHPLCSVPQGILVQCLGHTSDNGCAAEVARSLAPLMHTAMQMVRDAVHEQPTAGAITQCATGFAGAWSDNDW